MTAEQWTNDEIDEKTTSFLAKYIRKKNIDPDRDLFASGLINSLFAMQLILFLEKEFKIRVENEDLDIKNFRTINAMVDLVQRKTTVTAVN